MRSRHEPLGGDHRAAAAVLFALTLLPILGAVALAIDVGSAVWARGQLDLAADAASLTAAMDGTAALAANPNASLTPAQASGAQIFAAQAGALPSVALGPVSVNLTQSGNLVTAQVNYHATYTTRFAALFGAPGIPLGGQAIIGRTLSPYFAIDIVMDNSSSMLIGATASDMARLGNLVQKSPLYNQWGQGQACAFGCHFDSGSNDFYGLAHTNGVTLRMDVLNSAVQGVLNTIAASPQAAQFTVGLMTFTNTVTTLFPESSNIAAARTALSRITVPVTTSGGDADTNFPWIMSTLASNTPAAGDGSTPAKPLRYIFIVTDGVADYYSGTGARVLSPFTPTSCAALKSKGVRIMTLYTPYVPITTNDYYNTNVAPFINQVPGDLAACASSTNFSFQASDPSAISAAMQSMLQAAVSTPARFTY